MTESGVPRMKRNGARVFKNPPQPHMCIQDFIQGVAGPCYINVLSWEKIMKPSPNMPLQFYGGMRVRPPRMKAQAIVFAVMANPEVLQLNGKNAQDPKKQAGLIELLLDFVEGMNKGIIFTRQYTVLKDRDITGELKEVWNAVQARRDFEQSPPQQETWIDIQPGLVPAPDLYTQYQEHQQQEYTMQPPQYHSSVPYGRPINEMHYDDYGPPPQPQNMITQNDQMFHTFVEQRNVRRMGQVNCRSVHGENMSQDIVQQNCPAYPASQYDYNPRTMIHFMNKNLFPNSGINYIPIPNTNPALNTNLPPHFQLYASYQQRIDNAIAHMDMRRMQSQQQQIHLNHVQPVPQYEPAVTYNRMNKTPHMGVAQKNNQSKRQVNSPTHSKQTSCVRCGNDLFSNGVKLKSPVKVLQRESPPQEANNHVPNENNKVIVDKSSSEETKNVQVTDLDEEKSNDTDGETSEVSRKPNDTRSSCFTLTEAMIPIEDFVPNRETKTSKDPHDYKFRTIAIRGIVPKEDTEDDKTDRVKFWSDKEVDGEPQNAVHVIFKNMFRYHNAIQAARAQARSNVNVNGDTEETQQVYTILKKTESGTPEEIAGELAQLSIQDCQDVTTEVSPVLS